MRLLVVFIWACIGFTLNEGSVSYEGYKVYQITPKSEPEAELLLEYLGNADFDFWSEPPRILNYPVTVMVSPPAQSSFEGRLISVGVDYTLLIDNVERSIQEETFRQLLSPRSSLGGVTFTKYMQHNEINAYLRTLANNYPSIVNLVDFGTSFEGREMLLIEISSEPGNANKPSIFIEAGIHAREWIAPATALYLIQQLVENPEYSSLYQNITWAIIPSLNPDGYEYSYTANRLWRKTRTPGVSCDGTDPNRNFDYYWMGTGASDNECSQTFAGPEPFSEIETRLMRDYLLPRSENTKLYISIHSYGNYLLYPWGYTADLPDDADELQELGELVNDAISSVRGTQYRTGSTTNLLYAASGVSTDYVKAVAGVELSYCIELPGGGSTGFNPPASSIRGIVEETFEGFKAFHTYVENKFVG